jgi:hypothetical protein
MKYISIVISLIVLGSNHCDAQLEKTKYLLKRSAITQKVKSHYSKGNQDFYITNDLRLSLIRSPQNFLSEYSFYFKNKLDEHFYFNYDTANKISYIKTLNPYFEKIILLRSPITGFIDKILSSTYGRISFEYNVDSTISKIYYDIVDVDIIEHLGTVSATFSIDSTVQSQIQIQYDNVGNITSINDPWNHSKWIKDELVNINNYVRLASEYNNCVSCSYDSLGRFERYKQGVTSAAYSDLFDGSHQKIIKSKNEISIDKTRYPSCPNCKLSSDEHTGKLLLGISTDALGLIQASNNALYKISLKGKGSLWNDCYTKLLFLNYVYFDLNYSHFDKSTIYTKDTIVKLNTYQRTSLFQISTANLDTKINLFKFSDLNKSYELNIGAVLSLSHLSSRMFRYLYIASSIYGEFEFEIVRQKNFGMDCSIQYRNTKNKNDTDLRSFLDVYLIPGIGLHFGQNKNFNIELKTIHNITTKNNYASFNTIDLGYNIDLVPLLKVKHREKNYVFYRKRYIKERRFERIERRNKKHKNSNK